jgi:hypothetical protein
LKLHHLKPMVLARPALLLKKFKSLDTLKNLKQISNSLLTNKNDFNIS